jgi:hypothetical protein
MVILAMMFTCFYATLNGMNSMQNVIGMESRAGIVMHNLAARVLAEKAPELATVSQILADEFQKSPLANNGKLTVTCKDEGETILAGIIKPNGKPLAELRLRK